MKIRKLNVVSLILIISGVVITAISLFLLMIKENWGVVYIFAAGLILVLIGFILRAIYSEVKIRSWLKKEKLKDN